MYWWRAGLSLAAGPALQLTRHHAAQHRTLVPGTLAVIGLRARMCGSSRTRMRQCQLCSQRWPTTRTSDRRSPSVEVTGAQCGFPVEPTRSACEPADVNGA